MKTISKIALAVLLAVSLVGTASARVLKINESLGPGSNEEAALKRFAEIVKERTDGELEIRIFLLDQLGNPQTSLENLRTGSLELYSGAMEYYAGLAPEEWVPLSLPFLLRDQEHLKAYLNSETFEPARQKLLDRGIRFLSTEFNGDRGPYRVFISTTPVDSLDDIQNMRMRMFPNEIASGAWDALGAVPIQIAHTETYLALRQGTVAAATYPLSILRSMKFTEVAPHVLRTNEWPQTWPITISERVWQELSTEHQQVLVDAANEATRHYAELTMQNAASDIAFMEQEHDAVFTEIDLTAFREKIAPFHQELIAQGKLRQDVYESVLDLAE